MKEKIYLKEQLYLLPAKINLLLAIVADLHARDELEVVNSLKQWNPDIIAVPGDFVIRKRPKENGIYLDIPIVAYQKNVIPFLQECSEIAPTYVSLGNHESVLDEDDFEIISATGVTLLDNTYKNYNTGVIIGGLSAGHVTNYRKYKEAWLNEYGRTERYPSREQREMPRWFEVDSEWLNEFEARDEYKILLCHHPEYWSLREPYLNCRRIDLVLSGHAHGGQIRVLGQGLYAPGQGFFPKYTKGVWAGENGNLVISAGLSNTSMVVPRLFNPTEIVYVRLSVNA